MTPRSSAALAPVLPLKPGGHQPPVAALRRLAGRYDGPDDIGEQMKLAAALAAARTAVPPMYRGSPGDVLAAIYQAKVLDVGVAVALQHLHFNDLTGKSGMSGALMWALIIRAGHTIHVIGDPDDKSVEMELVRCDRQPGGRASWTIVEAAAAKLTSREAWVKYPADLLYWRCLSRLARRFASDVVQGMGYVPEELAHMTPEDFETDDRPVDPDIQELLADLDTLTLQEVGELRRAANRRGLGDRYAGTVEGRPVTVEAVIAARAERLLTEVAAAPAVSPAPAPPATTPGRSLTCGCDAARVIATGDHLAGCSEALGPPPPVDDAPRVWRCCGAPADSDHGPGCQLAEFEKAWQPLSLWPPAESDE